MSDRPQRRFQGRNPASSNPPLPQGEGFVVRLDPNAPPGELNFVFGEPEEATAKVPQNTALVAEGKGGIPPALHRAVNDVLAFIHEIDQPVESRGRKTRK